jgi:hypothetical protein
MVLYTRDSGQRALNDGHPSAQFVNFYAVVFLAGDGNGDLSRDKNNFVFEAF